MQTVKPNPQKKYRLNVRKYRAMVKLGCTDQERYHAQKVDYDVVVQFMEEPPSCKTDELSGTACYAQICEGLEDLSKRKPYKLIETLAYDAYFEIRKYIPESAYTSVTVTKINPPVPGLQGGSSFTLGDEF